MDDRNEPARVTVYEDGALPLNFGVGESVRSVIELGRTIGEFGSGIRRLLVITSEGRLLRVEHMDDAAFDRAIKRHHGGGFESVLKPLTRKHDGAQIGGEAAKGRDWMSA